MKVGALVDGSFKIIENINIDIDKINEEYLVENGYVDNKDVDIGSYPFFHAGKLGVSIVLRSENQSRIDESNLQILEFVNKYNLKKPYFHIANSKGLEILPDTFDYVRPGIAIYGGIKGYKPVMELRADVISTRLLKKGEGVGYDKKFIASNDLIISTIDVGYGDGIVYFRDGIKLKNTNALGKISMDSMIVEGEFKKEVVVFDDIKEFVKNFDTITYDILVKMSPRIKRVIV